MSKIRRQIALVALALSSMLFPGLVNAIEVTQDFHPLNAEVEYLRDPMGTLTLEHLLDDPSAHPFRSSAERRPDSSYDPVWLKIDLSFSEAALEKQYYLFARIENLFDIRVYRPDGSGGFDEFITGNDHPASTREVDSPRYGFVIEPSTVPQTLYLRYVGGPGANLFPWDLVEKETFLRSTHAYYSLDVAAFSAITTLLIFNLFIALSLRKAEYLYYSGYVLSVTLGLATLDGLGFYYIWPDWPAFNQRALHSFNLVSSGTRVLTILAFLGVASFAPRLYRGSLGVLGLMAAGFISVNLFGIARLPAYSLTYLWAMGILCGFAICGYGIWKRVRLAVPLFVTLLIPSAAAVMQGFLTVSGSGVGVFELQIAKFGFVIHVLMFSLCLAAQIKIETESRILALHDSLTGLPEATLLHEHFEVAANLSRREAMRIAVFFVDLDGFKAVNDTRGHATGDQLLVQVADRIQAQLRRADTVARIGGDEFVILLTQVKQIEGVSQVAEKLLTAVSQPYVIDGEQLHVSASIGISMFPDEGEDLKVLLSAADAAMYESKRRGKNTYTLCESGVAMQPGRLGTISRIGDNRTV